jgi:hypothetical protein
MSLLLFLHKLLSILDISKLLFHHFLNKKQKLIKILILKLQITSNQWIISTRAELIILYFTKKVVQKSVFSFSAFL